MYEQGFSGAETKVLEVDSLGASYGNIKVLHGISFTVDRGEIVTLIGANGAGKSTTLRIISGLLAAKVGSIRLFGEDITHLSAAGRVRAGVVQIPEGRHIFPEMTVRENLRMGAYTRKDNVEIEKDISMVFDKFPGLRPLGERYGGTLSGGEQQMLALGRALVARPRLMLMDEPSMGLAPFLVDRVFETIINLRGEGRTILLVEQNAQMALSIADRGYVLEVGNITMHGNAKDLRENEELRISYIGV